MSITLMEQFATSYLLVHNAAYDNSYSNSGELLFYVNDKEIINSFGFVIANFNYYSFNETAIVPVRTDGKTNKYLVITPLEYAVVDVCDQFILKSVTSTGVSDLDPFRTNPGIPTGLSSKLLAVSKEFLVNGQLKRLLFICSIIMDDNNQCNLFLDIYTIEGEQIIKYKTFTGAQLNFPSSAYIAGYTEEGLKCNTSTEMELVEINGEVEKFRLSFPFNMKDNNNNELVAVQVIEFYKFAFSDQSTLSPCDIQIYKHIPCTPTTNTAIIHGLEFSPDGNYLYFNYEQGCNSGNWGCQDDIRYYELGYSLPDPSLTSSSSIFPSGLASHTGISLSFIEIGYDGKMHLVYQDNANIRLCSFSNPAYPLNSVWSFTDFLNKSYSTTYICPSGGGSDCPTLSSYVLPDQIDGENYENEQSFEYCCEPPTVYVTINVTNEQEWTINSFIWGDIIVESGGKLTVKCKLSLSENSKIIVRPGGKLIIDGGHLTNLCGKMWPGIIVEGQSNQAQTTVNQGVVVLKNNAIIEYALKAIKVGDQLITSLNGGIVQGESSTIKDCYIGVILYDYQQPGNPTQNLCYFNNCNFICTGPLPDYCYGTSNFVKLFNVQGVRFYGNVFQNTYPIELMYPSGGPYYYCNNDRGIGIFSINSSFTVQKSYEQEPDPECKIPYGQPNRFIDLTIGIQHLVTIHDPYRFLKVLDSEFLNNEYAIITRHDDYSVIYKNLFTWNWPKWKFLNSDTVFGINSFEQNLSQILQNNFYWEIPECDPIYSHCNEARTFVGLKTEYPINYIDYGSEIIDNYFRNGESDYSYNNVAIFTGTDILTCLSSETILTLACNKYERMKYDWWIDACEGNNLGLLEQFRGDGVENEFSTTNNILQINNLAAPFWYYYHDPNIKPTSTYNILDPGFLAQNSVDCSINPCSIYVNSFKPESIARKSKENNNIEIIENKLDVFPVPAKDDVFVNYSLADSVCNAEMRVFNNFGQLVFSKKLNSQTGFITLDKEIISTPGIYICIISNNGKISLKKKFIVVK